MQPHMLLHSRRPGQAAVLAALCFVLLVGALGLAIDGASAFGERRRISAATDAAAMAGSRALLANLSRGNGGTRVNNAIEEFLTDRHDLGATLTWQAFYVDRASPDGTMAPVVDGARPPSGTDGVRVQVTYSFPTYFMGVFGQRSLTVGSSATAIFGPLGTAVGQDLAPLAISNTGRERIQDEGTVRIDLKGKLIEELNDPANWEYIDPLNPDLGLQPPEFPDDLITQADIKHVSFADVSGAPGTGDNCGGPANNSLTYWWCNGSPNQLQINRQLPAGDPSFSRLDGAIEWREDNRPVLVLPEYGDIGLYYELVGFIAVELRSYNPTTGVLVVRHLENYATAGAMVGEGSGVETGVWAINLKR